MKKDYLPRKESNFAGWEKQYAQIIASEAASFGITPGEAANLQSLHGLWEASYQVHIAAQNQAQAATERKDKDMKSLKSFIRILTRKIQANPSITNAMREKLGITVPDKIRTPLSEEIVLNEPSPVIRAKCTAPQTVRIDWYPSQAKGEKESLPKGISGVRIWVAQVTEKGVAEASWRFLTADTHSPYIHSVGNNGTITLAYKAQWFDRRQRTGPFGDPVEVAVTG